MEKSNSWRVDRIFYEIEKRRFFINRDSKKNWWFKNKEVMTHNEIEQYLSDKELNTFEYQLVMEGKIR